MMWFTVEGDNVADAFLLSKEVGKVLNKNGKSPIARNVQKTLDSMLIRSGCSITHCSLHGLRHGFGAILLINGVDIKIVSKLLGHEKISTTYDIYIDFTKEQVHNAVVSVLNKEH